MIEPRAARGWNLTRAWSERLVLAGVFLLPLVCWPGLDRPFSTPKIWLLAALAVIGVIAAIAQRRAAPPSQAPARPASADPVRAPHLPDAVAWPVLAWLAALGLSASLAPAVSLVALLVAVLPLSLFLGVCGGRIDEGRVVGAIAWSAALESLIVVLQWVGLDPLHALGWHADVSGSTRMRVYGTLGNPNFVAAWLCATLPLALSPLSRRARWPVVALLLQLTAIVATGSRVLVLTLPVALGVFLAARARRRAWWIAAVGAAVIVVWLSPARPLGVTVRGRYDLARITVAHLVQVPLTGFGAGSFEQQFADWQAQEAREHHQMPSTNPFAAPVDHAHNDYLEFWVEYGAPGVFCFLILLIWSFARMWPLRAGPAMVALAGACSLLVTALVDFPLHRPAEWTLLWMLLAVIDTRADPSDAGTGDASVMEGESTCPSQ